jgi:putative Holliday junction resolvase
VLAFDFGERFVGVAVGETGVGIAHPLATIDDPAAQGRFAEIADLVAEWKPARLVVGLPLALDGTPHELTRRAQRFARQLEGRFGLAVTLVDERLTSAEAEERLRTLGRRGPADKDLAHPLAAQVILQDFLDRHAAA